MQEMVARAFHITSEFLLKICQSARYLNLLMLRNDVAAWLFLTLWLIQEAELCIVIIFIIIFPFPPSNVSFLAAYNKVCCCCCC